MDRYDREVIVIAATMIVGFIALVVVYVKSGYNNLVAVVGFFVLLGLIAIVSKLSGYGDHELSRMTVDTERIENRDNQLLKERICLTCGRPLNLEDRDYCPHCGAGIKEEER